jgi:AmmeMemoRadiSam system protein B
VTDTSEIRPAAVAGQFYPGDANELAATVDRMIAESRPDATHSGITAESGASVIAALCPHAGYPYSGPTAAAAFSRIPPSTERVIIIGPSHVEAFDHVSFYDGAGYQTPLGTVAVDREYVRTLVSRADDPSIKMGSAGHRNESNRGEHSIEVELPFLQRICPSAVIVPVIMGAQSLPVAIRLGKAIRETIRETNNTVVIASSDLSHFYTDTHAEALDIAFCAALQNMDVTNMNDGFETGAFEACGSGAVMAMLTAIPDDSSTLTLLDRTHSGITTGDRDSVVGYASAIIQSRSEC